MQIDEDPKDRYNEATEATVTAAANKESAVPYV
jgi:hypothetical protein